MRRHIIGRKFLYRLIGVCAVICALLFACPDLSGKTTKADMVTDDIGVRVGYFGMELDDYVTVGDYNIQEIEKNLNIYEEAFSFFQTHGTVSSYTDSLYYGSEYRYIIDTARGFAVSDLLDYAGVYYADVYNLLFYTVDYDGYSQPSFDRDTLFTADSYYFENLPGHRRILYRTTASGLTDYSVIVGYDFSECWYYKTNVEPMLAIEDNWVSYTEEFTEAWPDNSNYNAGNRYRLLYGQAYPTDFNTHDSAKYVRWVYVTLEGSPSIGEMGELNGEYGSHEVEMYVESKYLADPDQMSQYMNIYSTNENVMIITSVTIEPVEPYSDLVKITIGYSIVGDGEATLGVGMGSNLAAVAYGENVSAESMTVNTADFNQSGGGTDDPEDTEGEGGGTDDPEGTEGEGGGTDVPEDTEGNINAESPDGSSDENQAQDGAGTSKSEEKSEQEEALKEAVGGALANLDEEAKESIAEKIQTGDIEAALEELENEEIERLSEDLEAEEIKNILEEALVEEEIESMLDEGLIEEITEENGGVFYRLSEDAQRLLEQLGLRGENEADGLVSVSSTPADKDITEVKVDDYGEEDEARARKILTITGLVCLGVCALGALSELISFRIRLGALSGLIGRLLSSLRPGDGSRA